MESDSTKPEDVAMFACRVTLDRRIKIPGRHAVQVDVWVKDPRIIAEELYALEIYLVLAARDDLSVSPTLVQAKKMGELDLMADIANLQMQKTRLYEKGIGRLVRVNELSEDQIEKTFQNLIDDQNSEKESDNADSQSGHLKKQSSQKIPEARLVDAKKLVITDQKQ